MRKEERSGGSAVEMMGGTGSAGKAAALVLWLAVVCTAGEGYANDNDHVKAVSGTAQPSFSCEKVAPGSTEALICEDEELALLDRKLAHVYAAAVKKAEDQHPPLLKAEQRGWIKGRNECWKAADRRECVRAEYEHRIAELQAWYRLVSHKGPFRFTCAGQPASEVVVTFFTTDPPTLIAERGDSVSLMYQQRSASGTLYRGRNEVFWEHQGEAMLTWGYGAAEERCLKAP